LPSGPYIYHNRPEWESLSQFRAEYIYANSVAGTVAMPGVVSRSKYYDPIPDMPIEGLPQDHMLGDRPESREILLEDGPRFAGFRPGYA